MQANCNIQNAEIVPIILFFFFFLYICDRLQIVLP